MSRLSQLAETLVGSEIVKLGNAIGERVRKGETIYNYTIGDFDPAIFPIPEILKREIALAYQNGRTNYPPADGIFELRKAVVDFAHTWHGLEYSENEVLIASGGRPLIYSLFKTIVDPGDKVIYAVPSWNNNHYTHMNGGIHCPIETTVDSLFMPTAADIEPHIKGATLLCLCTPQNPTGTTHSQKALKDICDLVLTENSRRAASDKKLYVMFDQMYGMLTYGDTRHFTPVGLRPEMKEFTIFVDGISKCFAATGLRVGWAIGPAAVISRMKALLTHIGAWAPMAEQVATAAFLSQTDAVTDYLEGFKAGLVERLNLIYSGILQLKAEGYAVDAIAPQAAMYLTVKFDLISMPGLEQRFKKQQDVSDYLLDAARLAVVPFSAFGGAPSSPWYRLSVGTCDKETIPAMLEQLRAALKKANSDEAVLNPAQS